MINPRCLDKLYRLALYCREIERLQQLLAAATGLSDQMQARVAQQERQHTTLAARKELQIAQLTQQLSNLQVRSWPRCSS